jgi:Tat protein translocase TatB subunit
MDILGIGFPELVLIFIIAMMVFGPRRLPELAAKAGKFIADLRNMSSGLMTEWQREITVATRLEELEKTRQEFEEIKEEVQQARKNLTVEAGSSVKELDQARKDVEQEVKSIPKSAAGDKSPAESPAPPAPTDNPMPPAAADPSISATDTAATRSDNNNQNQSLPASTQPAPAPVAAPSEVNSE